MKSLSERYPLWLCDIWGVVHDGFRPFTVNTDALARHRRRGRTVLLVTNSPRTAAGVERQLRRARVAARAEARAGPQAATIAYRTPVL